MEADVRGLGESAVFVHGGGMIPFGTTQPRVISIVCPHCKFTLKLDVDFVERAIQNKKYIVCVACEEMFQVLVQAEETQSEVK